MCNGLAMAISKAAYFCIMVENLSCFFWVEYFVDVFSMAVHPDKSKIASGQVAGVDLDGKVCAVSYYFVCA